MTTCTPVYSSGSTGSFSLAESSRGSGTTALLRTSGGDPRRVVSMGDLRDLERYGKALEKVYEHPLIKEDKHAEELLNRLL